jgi:hypothetical protein
LACLRLATTKRKLAHLIHDDVNIPPCLLSLDASFFFYIPKPSILLGTQDVEERRCGGAYPGPYRNAPASHRTNMLQNFKEEELVLEVEQR